MANLSTALRRTARLALLAALTASTALAVILARQKQSLEARYLELAARFHEPYVGMYVPGVRVPSIDGDSLFIGAEESQLLFVLGTTCPYTLASIPSWKVVAGRLAAESHMGVYGVSVDSLEVTGAYVEEHGLEFPVVTFTAAKTRALYHLQAVPQVLILDGEGRVMFARLGVIDSDLAVDSTLAAARNALQP